MNKITSFDPIQWAKVSKAEQIRTVANLIVEMNIDITEGYNNWRNIAFGISLELGEEGRSIFHDISRFNAGYKYEECDKLYSNCIKRLHDTTDHSGITIASFFKYAKEAGIEFHLTEEQEGKFNDFFNKLVEEYKDMLGRDFVANIYRMGLSAYRIAMILSITRLEGSTSLPECIICKDEDLECALIIADTLMQHAARIFSTLLPSKEGDDVMGIKLSPKSEKLFAALPASFNRQMVLAAAQKLGIAKRTAEKYVGEYVSRYNLCKRVDNGKYEKVDLAENQQDSTPR